MPDYRLPWIVRRFPLRQRLALVLHMAIALAAVVGFAALFLVVLVRSGVTELIDASDASSLIREVRTEVDGMQFDVYRFVAAGHRSAEVRVRERFQSTRARLQQCLDTDCVDDTQRTHLQRLQQHLQGFFDVFEEAAAQQRALGSLLDGDLEQALTAFLALLPSDEVIASDPVAGGRLHTVRDRLELVEQKARLLLGATVPAETLNPVAQLEELAPDIEWLADEFGRKAEFRASFQQLQVLLGEVLQRSRGYLFLVNVVMAAEASEMQALADGLESRLVARRDETDRRIDGNLTGFAWTLVVALVAGSALIYVTGYAMIASVAGPIRRISRIFSELAVGSLTPVRLDNPHADEIGELTRAARRFREENAEVQALILRHEALNRNLESHIADRTRQLEDSNRELERLARTDRLTGLANRRALDERLTEAIQVSETEGAPLAIMFIDLDHFKKVNDSHGHKAGDAVLEQLADLMRKLLREDDVPGRWGGEEFTIIGPDTDAEGMYALAERLRTVVEGQVFGSGLRLTISIGIAEHRPGENMTALIERADRALYQAKHRGRNRCKVAPESEDSPA